MPPGVTETCIPKLSYHKFKEGVEMLAGFFKRIDDYLSTMKKDLGQSDHICLHHWELKEERFPRMQCYLHHPPIIQRVVVEAAELADNSGVLQYEEAASGVDHGIFEDLTIATTKVFNDVEWSFSIVYSRVWSMPILYFHVQYIDGAFLTRKQILNLLTKEESGGNENNKFIKGKHEQMSLEDAGWDFISQEEHPITGVIAFFFHPCQTANRMNLIYSDQVNTIGENPCKWMLTWMSMILPAAGFKISPTLFQKMKIYGGGDS